MNLLCYNFHSMKYVNYRISYVYFACIELEYFNTQKFNRSQKYSQFDINLIKNNFHLFFSIIKAQTSKINAMA